MPLSHSSSSQEGTTNTDDPLDPEDWKTFRNQRGVRTGDQVRIYLNPADPDAHTHGTVCEITDVLKDDLDTETGRPTDAYSSRLQDPETDEKLPLAYRHQDLLPAEDSQ